jgi:hypothetical protein
MEDWRMWRIIYTSQPNHTLSDFVWLSGEPRNNPPYPPMLHYSIIAA